MRTIILMVMLKGLCAQSTAEPARFEAVSIKEVPPPMMRPESRLDPEGIDYKAVPLNALIMMAYGIGRDDLEGPAWMDSRFYDVTATVPPGTPRERRLLMLQSLLADRWELKTHLEKKIRAVFAVTVAKGGLKMKELPPGYDPAYPQAGRMSPAATSISGKFSISRLCTNLGSMSQLIHPMHDMTGLKGEYEVKLEWIPTENPPGTLFGEMEKQLGLKVEARKMPLDILVIDHVNKNPVGN